MSPVSIASFPAVVGLLVAASVAARAPARIDEPHAAATPAASPAYGTYAWPVRGPVVRGFDPPESAFGAGHRGIDIAAPFGARVVAASSGVVAFAGAIGGSLFVSIDHPDGVRTTYSWLSGVGVRRGERLARGEAIGSTGSGHPGSGSPHLHFGARIGEEYIDPMLLLERGSLVGLVHLAPLEPPADPSAPYP